MPTTQKVVLNAVISSGIGKDINGSRRLFLDNRYTAASLLIQLREQYDILCSGTTRANRIGWPKDQMNLSKKDDDRGTSKVLYDKVNKILVTQWVDSKVVSCTSTLNVSGLVDVKRRSGSTILNLLVERSLKLYQEGMDAVDRGDQYRELGAGFASKSHYKKWYKKAFFAVLDFMLLNSFFAWNMATMTHNSGKYVVTKNEYYAVIAEEMIAYVDKGEGYELVEDCTEVTCLDHTPELMDKKERPACMVCLLEENMRKRKGLKDKFNMNARTQGCISSCTDDGCCVKAHSMKMTNERKIFQMECFKGMTCFEIAHSDAGKSLWKRGDKQCKNTQHSFQSKHSNWKFTQCCCSGSG